MVECANFGGRRVGVVPVPVVLVVVVHSKPEISSHPKWHYCLLLLQRGEIGWRHVCVAELHSCFHIMGCLLLLQAG